ncbi:MAG: helix-turn-helix transcriptional regulator [Oscillospiraceae bacterium]|nr:helix-turn-helix transcriptional regulator [Oscillospiraceae bacterium]
MRYQRIRDLREDNDLTQAQVAEYLGVGQRAYAYYENGERMLPSEALCTLAQLYHVSTDYLLGLTDVKKPYPTGKMATRIP